MKRYEIKIDGESTEFSTLNFDWVKLEGFLLEEPFIYSNATKNEKQITDIIVQKLYLEHNEESIICISELEEIPKIRIDIGE